MKIALKILIIAGIILLVLVGLVAFVLVKAMLTPFVPNDYTKTVETGGEIEAKYLAMGGCEVKNTQAEAPGEWGEFRAYYPAALEQGEGKYPVVVFVNGTGVKASKYKALFRHLASWGFIVLGNEDPSTCTGASADATLTWLLEGNDNPDSVFYQKVDVGRIGISGHSQGGAGVFNAVTANEHSALYQAAAALSPTNEETAAALNMTYDLAKLDIPTLMLAGTEGEFETELVIPPAQMEKMYGRMDVPKAMARRRGSEHGGMLYQADGYVTAWFMWRLQGDGEAAKAFTGDSPELADNPLYQDVRIDLGQ